MYPRCCCTIAVFVTIICCAALTAEEKDWDAELSRGYANDAKQPLLDFLNDWRVKSKPISPELLKKKPAFEQAVYELYGVFFQPAKRHYKDTQFVVIQDTIDVQIVDSDLADVFDAKIWDRDWLLRKLPKISSVVCNDFRPQLKIEHKKLLYLQHDRLAAMLGFLTQDNGYRMLINNRYWDESCQEEDREKRLKYLNSAMVIFPGHWGAGWHFQTHPYIDAIYLSSDFKRAAVLYRVYYGGGEALMHRQDDGSWKVISMDDTWVE